MQKREYRYFMADFETTVYEGQQYTEVWAAAIAEFYTDNVTIMQSMGEFLDYVRSLKCNAIIYFHNLKFDGNFILDYMLRNNYHWNRVPEKQMMANDFKCAISDRGAWYSITVKMGRNIIEFRDSLKLLPFSVKKIGKSFATKHKKLDMEYEGFRYAGCEITEEERKYIANDILVPKEALELMFERGHTKLTIGSCCLSEFKSLYDKQDYENFFPDLTQFKIPSDIYGEDNADAYIRHSYRGGYCYLRKDKANKVFTRAGQRTLTVLTRPTCPANQEIIIR